MNALANPPQGHVPCRNTLLRAMTQVDLGRLLPLLEPVELKAGQILHHAHVPVSHFYFIESGLVSIEAEAERHKWTEVWQVGNEGCLGLALIVGREFSTYRRVALIDGRALRIPRQEFHAKVGELSSLRRVLLQYLFVVLMQTSRLSACNLRHSVSQRVARWLLLANDRHGGTDLHVTQSVLARVLGIRRASVSTCLGQLEELGYVRKERGTILVTDPRGLERIACSCYALIRREFDRGSSDLPAFDEHGAGRATEQLL